MITIQPGKAVRSLLRNRTNTLINLFGLSVAFCGAMLIFILVRSEFSFDKFHSKSQRIYRTWIRDRSQADHEFLSTITSLPLGPLLQSDLPQVERYSRVYRFDTRVKKSDVSFDEKIHMVDADFFKIFDFRLQGDEDGDNVPARLPSFPNPNSILITAKMARKYFGSSDVIGKTIEVSVADQPVLFTVSGIMNESPVESSIRYDFLIPFSNEHLLFNERIRTSFFNISVETYVLIKGGIAAADLQPGIRSFIRNRLGEKYDNDMFTIGFQPVTDIHLNNNLPAGIETISSRRYSYILISIGFLLLAVAIVNYILLSVNLSIKKSTEIGIKKVLGAGRLQLLMQLFLESILLTMVALVAGVLLMYLLYEPFSYLAGNAPVLRIDPWLIAFAIGIGILVATFSGLYPAMILSGNSILKEINGKEGSAGGNNFFKKSLIIFQFGLSIALIVCALGINTQLNFLYTKDLGYTGEHVLIVSTNQNADEGFRLAKLYADKLGNLSEVNKTSVVMYGLTESPWASMGFFDEKKT